MQNVRITKEFGFEMAHALTGYDGPCKYIHGHSYRMFVCVIGKPIQDENHPKFGMVMDFGDLKKIVNEEIVDPLDHAFTYNSRDTQYKPESLGEMGGKSIALDYQPTCENMVIDFAQRIQKRLPENLKLFSIKLHETPTSFAEWFASDN